MPATSWPQALQHLSPSDSESPKGHNPRSAVGETSCRPQVSLEPVPGVRTAERDGGEAGDVRTKRNDTSQSKEDDSAAGASTARRRSIAEMLAEDPLIAPSSAVQGGSVSRSSRLFSFGKLGTIPQPEGLTPRATSCASFQTAISIIRENGSVLAPLSHRPHEGRRLVETYAVKVAATSSVLTTEESASYVSSVGRYKLDDAITPAAQQGKRSEVGASTAPLEWGTSAHEASSSRSSATPPTSVSPTADSGSQTADAEFVPSRSAAVKGVKTGQDRKQTKELLTEAEKRANHIASEQKRRSLIRTGFRDLSEIVPHLRNVSNSKSTVLLKTVHFIRHLHQRNAALDLTVNELEERWRMVAASASVDANAGASWETRLQQGRPQQYYQPTHNPCHIPPMGSHQQQLPYPYGHFHQSEIPGGHQSMSPTWPFPNAADSSSASTSGQASSPSLQRQDDTRLPLNFQPVRRHSQPCLQPQQPHNGLSASGFSSSHTLHQPPPSAS